MVLCVCVDEKGGGVPSIQVALRDNLSSVRSAVMCSHSSRGGGVGGRGEEGRGWEALIWLCEQELQEALQESDVVTVSSVHHCC